MKKSIDEKLASHQAKVKAREDRIRKEEIELERERAALVDEGRRHFEGRLSALRQQAISYAEQAAKALAALPERPIEPKPELADTVGFDEYVRRAEAYPAAVEAYEEAAIAAARPLAVALRGLYHQACGVRNEAYKLGFAVYQGVGFIYECERGTGAVAGTALSAYGLAHDNPVAACIALAESGELTARHAVALVLLLRKQPETVTEKPATVWDRIKRLAAKREQDAEFAARGGPPMTQTERDVIKATELQERVWPGGTPTNIVNHELDRKAREAEAQRRAERQAEEDRRLEELGFARTGGS